VSDTLREAVEAAERHAAGQGDLDRRFIEQLQADPRQILAASDEERAYLVVLLDFAGLRDEAAWVLRDVDTSGADNFGPGSLNADCFRGGQREAWIRRLALYALFRYQ
jgi:hypothetical protein